MKCRILYPLQRDQSMKESLWPLGPFCCVGLFGEVVTPQMGHFHGLAVVFQPVN